MIRKMVVACALVVGCGAMGAGVASAGDPESPAEVLPTTVEVKGNVLEPLPKTGSDISADVLIGLGLTGAGVALAVSARQRRRRVEATAVASSTTT